MPKTTVTTGGVTLVPVDPDQERKVIVQNLGPTNFIEFDIGSTPALGQGFQLAAGATSSQFSLPPNTIVGAIANTASCDVRYLIS